MKTSNENNGGFTYNFVTIVLTFSIMLAVWNTFETCDMNDEELYDYVINTVMTSKGKGTGLGQEMEKLAQLSKRKSWWKKQKNRKSQF